MPCHAMPCHAMPCHVMSCHVMSCHVISYHFISYRIVSYHIINHITSYRISYIVSYRTVSYHTYIISSENAYFVMWRATQHITLNTRQFISFPLFSKFIIKYFFRVQFVFYFTFSFLKWKKVSPHDHSAMHRTFPRKFQVCNRVTSRHLTDTERLLSACDLTILSNNKMKDVQTFRVGRKLEPLD